MPKDFLQQLAAKAMPQRFTDQPSIDKIRVLRAADLVIADIPEPGEAGEACVHALTALGRATLAHASH